MLAPGPDAYWTARVTPSLSERPKLFSLLQNGVTFSQAFPLTRQTPKARGVEQQTCHTLRSSRGVPRGWSPPPAGTDELAAAHLPGPLPPGADACLLPCSLLPKPHSTDAHLPHARKQGCVRYLGVTQASMLVALAHICYSLGFSISPKAGSWVKFSHCLFCQ